MKSILCFLLLPTLFVSAQQPDLFKTWDRNRDGKLSREELPEGPRQNFERVDSDKDGFISQAEHENFAGPRKAPGTGPAARLPENIDAKLDLPYAATENPRQRLDLYLPKSRQGDKPLPVIVFIHGGGWQAGSKSSGIGSMGRFVSGGNYAGVSVGFLNLRSVSFAAPKT